MKQYVPIVSFIVLAGCGAEESEPRMDAAGSAKSPIQIQDTKQFEQRSVERYELFRGALAPHLNRNGGDLERFQPRAGITRTPMQRRFGHAMVARRARDGHLEYGCFDHAEHAATYLTNSLEERQK